MRTRLRLVGSLFLVLGGCAAIDTKTVEGPLTPVAGAGSRRIERSAEAFHVAVAFEGDRAVLTSTEAMRCRAIETRPGEREFTTERTLATPGTQFLIGGAGLATIAGGIVGVASQCPEVTGTTRSGAVLQEQCLPSDEKRQQGYNVGGAVAIGAGVALLGVVVVNLVRAVDSTEVRTEPVERIGTWSACGEEPDEGRALTVLVPGGGEFDVVTNQDGRAAVDLAKLEPTRRLVDRHVLEVRQDDALVGTFDIAASPLFAGWRATVDARQAEHEVRVAASAADRDARRREELRASIDANHKKLEAELANHRAIRPPWTDALVEKYSETVERADAVTQTDAEAGVATLEETRRFVILKLEILRVRAALNSGLESYVERRVAENRRKAAAHAASPEGIAAAERQRAEEAESRRRSERQGARRECERSCDSGEGKMKSACSSGDSACWDRARGAAEMCRAGCVR